MLGTMFTDSRTSQGLDEFGAASLSAVSDEVVATAKAISQQKPQLAQTHVQHLLEWYRQDYRHTVKDPTSLHTCMKTNAAYNGEFSSPPLRSSCTTPLFQNLFPSDICCVWGRSSVDVIEIGLFCIMNAARQACCWLDRWVICF